MKLLFTPEWLKAAIAAEDDIEGCPFCGAIAGACPDYPKCPNGESKMTTKVRIEIVQENMPVVLETLRSDGTVQLTQRLNKKGEFAEEYVHSGQTIRVRELTTAEIHAEG